MHPLPQTYPQVYTVQDWRASAFASGAPQSVPGVLDRSWTVPVPVVRLPPQVPQYDPRLAQLRNA